MTTVTINTEAKTTTVTTNYCNIRRNSRNRTNRNMSTNELTNNKNKIVY